jgi:plasmid stabilization system protein ParE
MGRKKMNRVVNVLPSALGDVDRAEHYLDGRRHGLGKRFRIRVERALKRIRNNPFQCAAGVHGVRRMPTEKFKYIVYYRILASETEVFAILHARRKSSIWKNRIVP